MIGHTILVVDDSEFDRSILVQALSRKSDFQFIEASSGDQCVEIISSTKIDLVLMDIMMPGRFGTQVLTKIREKFNPIELPVIMVTSKSDNIDIINCLKCGANDYITKPVNFDVAICRIDTHVKLAEASHEMSKLRELSVLDAMITTYNHEINNPLTIAISCLSINNLNDPSAKEKLHCSLWRIADIVKKISSVTEQKEIKFQAYSKLQKMVKI